MVDILSAVLLGTCLAVTALVQIDTPLSYRLLGLDYFALLPDWRLFAPDPMASDFVVLSRGFDEQQSPNRWRHIRSPEPRHWWAGFFNPSRRRDKALFDACKGLSRIDAAASDIVPAEVIEYWRLVQLAAQSQAGASAVQFLVFQHPSLGSIQGGPPRLFALSGVHDRDHVVG